MESEAQGQIKSIRELEDQFIDQMSNALSKLREIQPHEAELIIPLVAAIATNIQLKITLKLL